VKAALKIGSAALVLGAMALGGSSAHAAIVERVVAIVGERAILLSELRHRARPFLVRIQAQQPTTTPTQQVAIENQAFKEVLGRMIDDRLEDQAADKAHINVSSEDVEDAIKRISVAKKESAADLLKEATREGLTEIDYREELRRQILEAKLLELRVRGRVRVTEQDARAMYTRWAKEQENLVELRLIALRILPGTNAQDIHAREVLAQDIVSHVRKGEDYCDYVTKYSDDVQTKDTCGSRGPQPIDSVIPQLRDQVRLLRDGEVSDPIRFGDEAWVIVQRAKPADPSKNGVPPYAEVKDTMMQRAYGEAFDHQREIWLSELKRGVYIDVRL
jgi:peptidyl-prolyl cis-trans isomerase SurA